MEANACQVHDIRSSVLYIDFHRWDKITDLNNLNRKDLC